MSHVWYVSYGSNMSSARLACYLEGGCPPGGSRVNPGARDRTPPRRSVPVDLPGSLYFAGESPQWGGGVAVYDHFDRAEGARAGTAARGYLLSVGQFVDVAVQEMHRTPRNGDPLEQVALAPLEGGMHTFGPGRYETLHDVGWIDDVPLLLFTSAAPHHAVPRTAPSTAYSSTIAAGLRESRDWDEERIVAYLDARTASPQ